LTPEISARARALPASPIRKLVPLADRARARGVHVYHLNIGQPDLPTPPELLSAVRSFALPLLSYSPSHGEADCLDFWLEYYRRIGFALEREDVNVTTGGSEAILFALLGVAAPGDEVIVFEPFYTNYRAIAQVAGLVLVPVTTGAGDGYHLPAADVVARRIGPRTRAIVLCNPNNPTGTVYSSRELAMVAELARQHGLFWVCDEVYREFVYADEPARSALSFPELAQQVVIVDSVSKRFSACGARVGCVVSRNRDLMQAWRRQAHAPPASPTLGQVLAAAGRLLPPSYFEASRAEYRRRRDLLHESLNAIPGVFSRRPEGAFYTMARLPVGDAEEFASWLLTDYQREGKTVMLAPGAGFYATPGLGRDEVRIAYVLNVDDLREAMLALRDALAVYPGRKPA
jgi:aspartate aminotransferase